MAFRTSLRHKENDVQSPVTADANGNTRNIAIRGTTVEMGDGAQAAANSVAIGDGIVNALSNSVSLGGNSVKLAHFAQGGHSFYTVAPVAPAGAAPNATSVYSGIYNLNAALTWPSAASVVSAFPNAAVGDTCLFTVVNSTAGALAQAGPGGATVLDPSWSIDAHGARTFVIRLTNVGSGTEAYSVS